MKIIGIDIDGVLNDHCRHFCDVLKKLTNKNLNPDDIVKIPVHKIDNIDISLDEEKRVFHDISYWKDMPPSIPEFSVLKRIKSKLKIYLFTNREWPDKKFLRSNKKIKDVWKNMTIAKLTKDWLAKYMIPYDKLCIERNHSFLRILNSNNNRFTMAKNDKIDYFVEDNLLNAEKLSLYCSKIFLIQQPYNKFLSLNSGNIIRVNDIKEIINYI